jgi:hypothetical protein
MLCRACGMDSRTENACEWCNKPMQGPAPKGQGTAYPTAPPAAPLLNTPSLNPSLTMNPNAQPLNAPLPNAVPPLYTTPGQPLTGMSAQSLNAPVPPVAPGTAPVYQQPLTNSPQPAPTARIQRTTLSGEVIEVPSVMEAAQQTGPGMFAGQNPNATTVMTPGGTYAGAPYAAMNAAGASYGAMAPQMLRDQAGMPQASAGEKWELFLAIAAPILLLSAWLVHIKPQAISWIGFVDLFVLALTMGATGAVPSYDDSYFDVTIMLVVTFLFGPIIALVVYLITAAIKQECNGAVVGLLALQILVFQGMAMAFASNTEAMKHVGAFMLFGIMQFFAVFVGFIGWLLSSLLRPVGE